jgi:hypothetical protein
VEVLACGRDVGRVILIDEEEAHAQRIIPQRVARSSLGPLAAAFSASVRVPPQMDKLRVLLLRLDPQHAKTPAVPRWS